MKQYYSCAELAEMKLDGYPLTERNMRSRAQKENWPSRKREGRGGGMEYMPSRAVINLIKKHEIEQAVSSVNEDVKNDVKATNLTTKVQDLSSLKDWQRNTAEARAAICAEIKRLSDIGGTDAAIMQLINQAAEESLPEQIASLISIANARSGKAGKRTLSRRTLYGWLKDFKQGGVASLAPKSVEKLDVPAWGPYLLALYGRPQKPSLAYCMEILPGELPDNVEMPSYSAANRFIKKMGNVDVHKGRMGHREIKNIKPFVRRDTTEMWPGDAYTADGHTFDAEIAHPMHGRPFRPEMTTVLDINTRKLVGWSVGLAESTWAVLDALRQAVVDHGIPSIFYVDNGSGYKNAAMSNEATGFMGRLSITLTHSLPYNSQARGLEERSHQTIWVRGAKTLTTFIGKDMDAEAKQKAFKLTRADIKKTGKSRYLMPWDMFLSWCEEQVGSYNNRPHRSLPKVYGEDGRKRHMTPNEAWQQAVKEGWKPVNVESYEADDLFRPYKEAITRRGEVTLFTNTYFSHDLEQYHGETVRVGYDIHDASRVWVRNKAGQLICVAEFEANKSSYFPRSVLEQAAEKRALGRIQRAQAKIEEAEQELNPTLAIEQQQTMEIPTDISAQIAEARLIAENEAVIPLKASRPMFETDAQKYRWLIENSGDISRDDQGWIDWYMTTEEYGDLFLDDKELAIR